jgi:hypothetical protein
MLRRVSSKMVGIGLIGISLIVVMLTSLSWAGPVQAQSGAPDLQVWIQPVHNEQVNYHIEYREASGTMLASYDLPQQPNLEPVRHQAGRLIGTGDLRSILLFTPYSGHVEVLTVPAMPTDFGDDWYQVTGTILSPDAQQYVYTFSHLPSEFTQGRTATSDIYIATPYANNDRLITSVQHDSPVALLTRGWSADGTHLLVYEMPQGVGGYILFWTYQEARIIDLNGNVVSQLGNISGFSSNFNMVALVERSSNGVTGIAVTDVLSGAVARYPLPQLGETAQTGGAPVFSPDERYIAYQVARNNPDNELFWTIVIDRVSGESRVVFTDTATNYRPGYGYIGGWLDNTTLAIGDIWSGNTAVVDVTTGTLLRTEPGHVFLGYATGIQNTTGFAPQTEVVTSCPGTPIQRLRVGITGRITFTNGSPTNVRDQAGVQSNVLASLPEGTTFTVIGGPACEGNYSWWRLQFPDGLIGWVAEGDPGGYFLEPWR